MLSGVASLLFGSYAEKNDDVPQEKDKVDLVTNDTELGWVLVDMPNDESSASNDRRQPQGEQQQPVAAEPVYEAQHQVDQTCVLSSSLSLSQSQIQSVPHPVQANDSGLVDQHISPYFCVLEDAVSGRCSPFDDGFTAQSHETLFVQIFAESWILTPPPCFTASGSLKPLEESPLENLLIEHPSMSVYNIQGAWPEHMPREEVTGTPTPASEAENSSTLAPQLVQHQTTRPLFRQTTCLRDLIKTEGVSQRQQRAAVGKMLQKKCMERSNKAFHIRGYMKQGASLHRRLRSSGFKNGCHRQRNH